MKYHTLFFSFFHKLGKMSQNLVSAAVVIGALRVKACAIKFGCKVRLIFTLLYLDSLPYILNLCVIRSLLLQYQDLIQTGKPCANRIVPDHPAPIGAYLFEFHGAFCR